MFWIYKITVCVISFCYFSYLYSLYRNIKKEKRKERELEAEREYYIRECKRKRIKEILMKKFNNDEEMVYLWLNNRGGSAFCMYSPNEMIIIGGEDYVLKFLNETWGK